ncbi:MAG: diaminopimelate decarboxylase [Thermodesulfobacteriota bacterium]|nr:diaminopimelate decarboxylase [Thermodesulfobacteriota bacterium]
MNYFKYANGELFCENIKVEEIAEYVGTPFYLYSMKTLKKHYTVFHEAFSPVPHIICFSVKANSNLSVLKTFFDMGGGADVVSGGELYRALKAGAPSEKIVYSGVGKTEEEIKYALGKNILFFNVESEGEIYNLDKIAYSIKKKARIALRVNPDIDPRTHSYISTGLKENKFGIRIEEAKEMYIKAKKLNNIEIVGVDCHIGSQITEIEPFIQALKKVLSLIDQVKKEGIRINFLDLGGGLGITYKDETPPYPDIYAGKIINEIKTRDLNLILEPGRAIVGNAGILVTRVLHTKKGEGKDFVIIDAAMNDLVRPSFYGSFHEIKPVKPTKRGEITADVVGPVCETGDFLAKKRKMQEVLPGELLAVMSAGAYGFTMSSNYNSRPRVPEVMVMDDRYYIIRRRETYKDLIRGEEIPEELFKL